MPLNKKNLHIKLTEHGFFKCSKFSSLINFHGLNRHLSVLLDHLSLTLDRKGDKRKIRRRAARMGGDYSRDAIILNISVQGRRLIEGRLLFEEIRYIHMISLPYTLGRLPVHKFTSFFNSNACLHFTILTFATLPSLLFFL